MSLISLLLCRAGVALEFVRGRPQYPKRHSGVSKMMHPKHFANSALQKISPEFTGMTLHSLKLLLGTVLAQPAPVQAQRTIFGQLRS
jgi:hypothetical protein